ncbi:xanthine dehydrogenase family protein molybdopterin-binding subunit [Stagnihabitans tardus]|uniref:Molybdopterin-dependent oxidoreductase n=1 Tax=Stagnihabitans tardus TaxID=2699202 RepID=A0AAE5BWE5_9RHOB|nr:molybdopterin cofactor-binding domain-containing protein [Stagnihabitans tardus]NBZ89931.1 molybdopterin-dependent oxidoreductase [Stagnihabitans tardus]
MASLRKIARRSFLFGSLALAGGVAFGWWKYKTPYPNPLRPETGATLNAYVMIDEGGVTLVAPRAEMGQGIHTTLAALVAEEMDLELAAVKVIHGPASAAYFNAGALEEGAPFLPIDESWLASTVRDAMHVPGKFLGLQITGGSSSVIDAFDKMRLAGAAARAALVQAASGRLGVAAAELKTESGAVIAPDGTRLTYADLAVEAAGLALDQAPLPKPREAWRILGKSQPRVDMVAKVTGTAQFTADLRLPGMVFATARTNPGLGAGVKSFDDKAALAVPGVSHVVPIPGGLAVVASSTWAAFKGAEALVVDWEPAPYPDSAGVTEALKAAFDGEADSRNRDEGDVEAALTGELFEAEYSAPYLAHATMEPMTAAALVKDGALTVWSGNQLPTQILAVGAQITGLPQEAIEVETLLMGGGFGRRAEMDIVTQVVTLAKALEGRPVLLTWTREEDMTHDMYRPAALGRVRAKLEAGRVLAFDAGTVSSSVVAGFAGRMGYSVPGPDATIVQGLADQPYVFANHRVTGYRAPDMLPVGNWRSVGNSQNVFFGETAMDELAALAGSDPLSFRLDHLDHAPSRLVLETVAEMADWGAPRPGRALGVGFCIAFGVPSAQVIEVEMVEGRVRMTGAWAAVDVGLALDPSILEAQVTGAMIYGLSAAIRGEITVKGGAVEQATFWDYEPLRMPQIPPMQVRVLETMPRIRGIGEPGTPPAAPALGNAIFALTGQRLREMPFGRTFDFA